jgi:hypothetical protein
MFGTALILLLVVLVASRLPAIPPARRAAAAFALGIGAPVLAVTLVARFGVQPDPETILIVFAAIAGAVWWFTRTLETGGHSRWIGMLGASFVVATLSALLGRPPAAGVLIDPWAHIAWSRDLPHVFDLYPPGFPAFISILGADDPLIGAFRLAPFLLHSALAAQFLAIGEAFGAVWPAAVASLAYLVVPVAFGKFEPPRPEIFAAVCITASWWIYAVGLPRRMWTYASLATVTCLLIIAHVSILEIAHLGAMFFCVVFGASGGFAGNRRGAIIALLSGMSLALAISPWPLRVLADSSSVLDVPSAHTTASFPGAADIVRMWGPGLVASGAAGVAWYLSRLSVIRPRPRWFLIGIGVFGVLVLAPPLLIAAGAGLPIPLATYRFYLSAAVPLAMGAAVAGALAWHEKRSSRIGVVVCALIVALDFYHRPSFSVAAGLASLVLIAATWSVARRPRRAWGFAVAAALALGIAARLVIWIPEAPPEAEWLARRGDPRATAVTNWPEIVVLDALAPQRAVDGLAGKDGNTARHRSAGLSPLGTRLYWCGDDLRGEVDRLRATLDEMNALPAYIVLSERFAESWSVYAEQRAHFNARGELETHPDWLAEPCSTTAARRVRAIRAALDSASAVVREFSTDDTAIYRMDRKEGDGQAGGPE